MKTNDIDAQHDKHQELASPIPLAPNRRSHLRMFGFSALCTVSTQITSPEPERVSPSDALLKKHFRVCGPSCQTTTSPHTLPSTNRLPCHKKHGQPIQNHAFTKNRRLASQPVAAASYLRGEHLFPGSQRDTFFSRLRAQSLGQKASHRPGDVCIGLPDPSIIPLPQKKFPLAHDDAMP